jgi:hypothetical protein
MPQTGLFQNWQAVEITVSKKDEDGKESSTVMVERAISP